MHFTSIDWTFIGLIGIVTIGVIGVLFEVFIEGRKEKQAKSLWRKAEYDLKDWLKNNKHKNIESPEAQSLLLCEVYAYTTYLHTKRYVEEKEKIHLQKLLDSILENSSYPDPYV